MCLGNKFFVFKSSKVGSRWKNSRHYAFHEFIYVSLAGCVSFTPWNITGTTPPPPPPHRLSITATQERGELELHAGSSGRRVVWACQHSDVQGATRSISGQNTGVCDDMLRRQNQDGGEVWEDIIIKKKRLEELLWIKLLIRPKPGKGRTWRARTEQV